MLQSYFDDSSTKIKIRICSKLESFRVVLINFLEHKNLSSTCKLHLIENCNTKTYSTCSSIFCFAHFATPKFIPLHKNHNSLKTRVLQIHLDQFSTACESILLFHMKMCFTQHFENL